MGGVKTYKLEMKITIKYIAREFFDNGKIRDWFFKFKRYKYLKGFYLRFFGVHLNVVERDSLKRWHVKIGSNGKFC